MSNQPSGATREGIAALLKSCGVQPALAELTRAIPNGMALVPAELTAENGMKAALMGEVFFYPYEGREPVIVPWDKIKELHRLVVAVARRTPVGCSICEKIADRSCVVNGCPFRI